MTKHASSSSDELLDDSPDDEHFLRTFGKRKLNKIATKLLKRFARYLQGADGGYKTTEGAYRLVRQLTVMWTATSPNSELKDLLDRQTLRDRCINKLHEHTQPGTYSSYLSSLGLFMDFLDISKLANSADIQTIRSSLKGWKRSISKEKKARGYAVKLMDRGIK